MIPSAMPMSDPNKPPKAYDGVIPPKKSGAADHPWLRGNVSGVFNSEDGREGLAHSPTLDEVDAAIAEDADSVIESVFASVEDLLGDSFSMDDEPESADNLSEESVDDSEVDEELAARNSEDQADATAAEPVEAAEGADVIKPVGAADNEEPGKEGEETEHVDEPPSFSFDETEPQAFDSTECDVPDFDAAEEELALGKRSILSSFADFIWRRASFMRPRRLRAALVAICTVMSWPLQFVPDWARPYVDWLALSLVFWIPVIWIAAFLVVGRS